MSVLINKDTKVIVQGITGGMGKTHTALMKAYGTNIVAGVTPGKGGMDVDGIPVYDSVAEAVEKVDAGPRGVVLTIRHQDVQEPSVILNAITQNGGWKLRPDQTILVAGHFEKPQNRIKGVERALKALIQD